MFDFFKAKPPIRQRQSARPVVAPFPRGMTIERWRSDGLAAQVGELYRSQLFGDILAVLHNSVPVGFPIRGQAVTEMQAAIELGRIQGYHDCLRILESLPLIVPHVETVIESTFEPEPVPETEEEPTP